MQARWIALLLSTSACSAALKPGDAAFARRRYAEAAALYGRVEKDEPDAVLFRRAVLASIPNTSQYDPERARALLHELQQKFPDSPYGVAATRALERLAQAEALEARLHAVEQELDALKEAHSKTEAALQTESDAHKADLKKADDDRQRLAAELKAARDSQANLDALQDENDHLKSEIEELKLIDLRH